MGALKEFVQTYLKRKLEYDRKKIRSSEPDYFFNQKKQIWYHMMDAIDGEAPLTDEGEKEHDS